MKRRRSRHLVRRRFAAGLAWALAGIAVSALNVWVQLQTKSVGYEIAAARRLVTKFSDENRRLEAELATVTSMASLDRAARERLGMRPPEEGQLVGMP